MRETSGAEIREGPIVSNTKDIGNTKTPLTVKIIASKVFNGIKSAAKGTVTTSKNRRVREDVSG